MIGIHIICVGKLKEKFYLEASAEYLKRLSKYCKLQIIELPEAKRPSDPTEGDIKAALEKEAAMIREKIPKGAAIIPMCIEGKQIDSVALSTLMGNYASAGVSKLCFLIGGSDGLHEGIKALGDVKLSMSKMTFPHHLARVMLLEQIYRGFKIQEGSRYHK